jgi:hypothetical protein
MRLVMVLIAAQRIMASEVMSRPKVSVTMNRFLPLIF